MADENDDGDDDDDDDEGDNNCAGNDDDDGDDGVHGQRFWSFAGLVLHLQGLNTGRRQTLK